MPRVVVLRGSLPLLQRELASRTDVAPVVIDTQPRAWTGLRSLIGTLVAAGEGPAIEAAIAGQRAAFSLVFPQLATGLDAGEVGERERLAATVPGYLSHNSVILHPLRSRIADALAPIVRGRTLALLGAESIDLHTLALLRRWLVAGEVSLILACDRERIPNDPLARREALQVAAVIDSLAAGDDAEQRELADATADAGEVPRSSIAPWDRRDEDAALALLDAGGPLVLAPVLVAIEACWSAYAFTPCLALGLRLLARSDELDADTHRRVALLAAIAAYNRQVSSRGENAAADAALAELLDRLYRLALAGEADPLARSHLHYRLALNLGRRRAEFPLALEQIDLAVACAREAATREPACASYFEAWALNGEAYVRGRMGELDRAIELVAAALAACEPLAGRLPPGLDAELPMTATVLVDNLGMLEAWAGRPERALAWEAEYRRRADALGAALGYSGHWIEHRVALGDLAGALELAEHGLRVAEQNLATLDADYFAAWLGELLYRRGDAERARAAFARAGELGHRLGRDGEAEPSTVAVALADMRCGRLAEAEAVFEYLNAASELPERAIEYLAQRGLIVAMQGRGEDADAILNEAITQAVALGERDVLLRVALAAGEASLALGRPEDAAAAFGQARELAESDPPAQPADRLAALAGGFAAGQLDDASILASLELLDAALHDAESWWQLERIARALLASDVREGAWLLEQRLAQRVDVDRELLVGLHEAHRSTRS